MALLTAVETSSAADNLSVTAKAEDVDWTSEIYFDPQVTNEILHSAKDWIYRRLTAAQVGCE